MRVEQIVIQNILGIENLTIKPGSLTVISGKNAAGKSSVLAALKNLADGGHDPTLLRQGYDQASVSMILDDGVEIFKVIKPSKSVTTVIHPKLGKISKPASWIAEILDGLSLDPVQFLTLKTKPRVDLLLSALPLKLDLRQVEQVIPSAYHKMLQQGLHPLALLGALRREMYAKRREVNTLAREKRAAASQIMTTLPPPTGTDSPDWATEVRSLKARKTAAETTIEEKAEGARDFARQQIEEARARLEAELAVIRERYEQIYERIRTERDSILAQIETTYRPVTDEISRLLGAAEEKEREEIQAGERQQMIARFEEDAIAVEKHAQELSTALDAIQGLKEGLLANLPLKDLELVDDTFEVKGIPFDRLNDAEKYRFVVELAKLKAGNLGLILLDRTEIFDPDNWDLFVKTALESGLQVIAAKVADQEMSIRTF